MSGAAEARAAALGEAAVRRVRGAVAARVREQVGTGGIAVAETDDGVVLTGRHIGVRFLDDAGLRWVTGMLR